MGSFYSFKTVILIIYNCLKCICQLLLEMLPRGILLCVAGTMILILFLSSSELTEAHIFVDSPNVSFKDKGPYRVIFLPFPGTPRVNDSSTQLNFSVQNNNTDVVALFVSLILQDKVSGKILLQTPYKFHEFGDVTFPFVFKKSGQYVVSLQSKINGDPLYKQNPLLVSFDLAVDDMDNKTQDLLLFFVLPFSIMGFIVIYFYVRPKATTKYPRDAKRQD